MDVLPQSSTSSIDNQELYNTIREGTSVERDHRMRRQGEEGFRRRPRDVPPGAWLEDSRSGTGLLSSLSYASSLQGKEYTLDRSVHRHFALTTSVRPVLLEPSTRRDDDDGITMRNYLTTLVQSMGIRYRPERSMATVTNQAFSELTFGNEDACYGAGIYWKHVLPKVDTPVVAVLGNTTRAFVSLDHISTNMKSTMKSPRFRGYYTRDVLNGVLPEMDDCEEALEACWEKRDLYHPPSGFGFDDSDNGEEF
jgi:hypothetical protein